VETVFRYVKQLSKMQVITVSRGDDATVSATTVNDCHSSVMQFLGLTSSEDFVTTSLYFSWKGLCVKNSGRTKLLSADAAMAIHCRLCS